MNKRKKTGSIMLALVISVSMLLSACSNNGGNNAPTNGGTNTPANQAENNKSGEAALAAEQIFRMNLHAEPPTLDPGMTQDNTSGTVLNAVMEGLTTVDKDGNVQPGMAEKWEVSEDNLTYTFTILDGATWSTGEPVTAHDFEFAWKRVLDPTKETPSPYAYQLYYLKNAEAYNTGEIKDASQVGVKAQDDKTLVVELHSPTAYFLNLLSFYTYYPVNKAVVEANPKFAAEAATHSTNGPFLLTEWNHNESLLLTKNPNYYDADKVHFTEVRLAIINDSNTELSMYETGDLDWAGRPTGEIPIDMIPSLKEDSEANLQIQGIATTYYFNFNTTKEPYDNVNIRKALAMAIDRKAIVEKVTLGDQIPAFGFVPYGIKGQNDTFRDEVKDSYFTEDVEQAKTLLAKGLEEKGLTKLPTIELIHNEGEGHKKLATAIADMWKTNLGVDVSVQSQEWGVFLTNRTNLNYQVARAGWGADYNDPMTFLDMWITGGGNNDTGFSNAEYDGLIKKAQTSSDPAERMEAMAAAEKILMDEMPILPIYYYTGIWMQKPYVQGVWIDYSGEIRFNYGYIAEH
ncbi:peptide ABC transporter substrate-binding protein [Paenibacillus sambharensis]|uniref:Peptide ABC transporter substrate-binding protein n=1 Tax=Paenibacillus sambharensis TaxID=1803190 RepID=A0A2W1LNC4_9BACL|nr:peptide ABC transporter substrate-binding protein [Paenibacillus sambharensis]PZD96432.1 peptide ABC transporter substrate-binding protein [Paenibacillus sambharensis]